MEKPEAEHHPIDRGWAWVVLFACFLEQLLLIGSHASFGILFNEFTVAFNSSATSISIALSVQTVVLSLASLIILSVGSQWLSNRTFVMMGAVSAFAAYIFNAFLPGISYLILSQGILFGFTHACVQGPSLVILGRYFKKYRGLATTLANFGASTGVFIFPLVLRSLIDFYGLRGALIIQSGLLLNLLVAGSLFRPLSFYDKLPKKYLEEAEKGARVDGEQQEQLLQAIIGSTSGVYFALFPAVLADFVGLENLSGAMGLTMLTHGLALTIGNPILGSIRDSTGTFNGSFLYTGGCTFLSAAAMTIAHFYEKKRNKNLQNRHDIIEIVADEP
ncbi:monocarboxylate transporter 13-like isoform X4 [Crassostrea virginica]